MAYITIPMSGGGGSSGAWTKIGEAVAGSGDLTITHNTIPSTYKNLVFVFRNARSTGGGTGAAQILMNFESDAGAGHYNYQVMTATAGTVASSGTSTTAFQVGYLPKSGDLANSYSAIEGWIFDYADTTHFKEYISREHMQWAAGSQHLFFAGGNWNLTTPIQRIDWTIQGGLGFAAGTTVELFGVS
jgi:hypothetical protein